MGKVIVERDKMTKFDTPSFRRAFNIHHSDTNDVDGVTYKDAEHTAMEVEAWAVSDAGRHENKNGIYIGAFFGNVDENERRYVAIHLTRKQLKSLLDAVDKRFPISGE